MTRNEAIMRLFTHCPHIGTDHLRDGILEALVAFDLIKLDEAPKPLVMQCLETGETFAPQGPKSK